MGILWGSFTWASATAGRARPIVLAMLRSPSVALLVVLALSPLGSGCSYPPRMAKSLVPPEKAATLDRKAPYLKAHLRDGRVYLLTHWSVDEGQGSACKKFRRTSRRSKIAR